MRVYIAGRFIRQKEFLEYAKILHNQGWVVTSRWLVGHTDIAESMIYAQEDYEDVLSCDMLISFTESENGGRGGRHVELGMGIAWNKKIVIIGPTENVFHYMRDVIQYDSFADFCKSNNLKDR